MSIPDRLYRIAKGHIDKFQDYFDPDDLAYEREQALIEKGRRLEARRDARQELNDPYTTATSAPTKRIESSPTINPLRSPQDIVSGTNRSSSVDTGTSARSMQTSSTTTLIDSAHDPLTPHYRMLGMEPGSDYAQVQLVYEKLAERCRPDRFPAGSEAAKEVTELRQRLEESYKALQSVLDPTTRRFDMLEI